MPQYIEVPDLGTVEFPDGMDDAAISEAIQRTLKSRASQLKPEPGYTTGSQPVVEPSAPWISRQAPLKGAAQEVAKLPGRLLRTFGTAEQILPEIDPGIYEGAGPSQDEVTAENRRRSSRTAAQTISEVEQNPLVLKGREIEEKAAKAIPVSAEEEKGFLTGVGRGAGSMVPYVVAGPAAPALIGLESFSDHVVNDFEAEKAKGKSEGEAAKTAFTKAIVSGGTQALIFAVLPKPLRKLGDKWLVDRYGTAVIKRFLASRAANVGEGAALGAASRISENAVEGEDLSKGVLESAGGMAALMGVSPRGKTEAEQALLGPPKNRFDANRQGLGETLPIPTGGEPTLQFTTETEKRNRFPGQGVIGVRSMSGQPIEPGGIGEIPEGGTLPVRRRIRITLPPTVGQTTPRVPQSEIPKQDSPSGLFPAIRLMGGDVVVGKVGETHPDIIDREKLDAKDIDQRGFVDKAGKFLDREQAAAVTGLPNNFEPGRLHSTDLPATKGTSDQTQTRSEEKIVQTSAVPPVGQGEPPLGQAEVKTEAGTPQRQGEDQAPAQLNIPTAEELNAKDVDAFDTYFRSLGKRAQEAQKLTGSTTSPVKLRQFALESANEYNRLKNEAMAKTKAGGTLTVAEMDTIGKASTKMQYFNEALREAGEAPIQPELLGGTIESQVGKKKKPSGGRTPGMTPREVGLINELEKLENDSSISIRSGKQQVNADELKTDDVIVVRGEPLTVTGIDPDEGTVTLKGEKGGRWVERTLQAGQQIAVDEYRPAKDSGFDPGISKEKPPLAEAKTTVKEPIPAAAQKYRLKNEGPKLYTLLEKLPQTDAEREAGEQPVRVRNDQTGKEDVVLESQLQPVTERSAEEKAKSKPMSKRELDDALRKFGMEPSEFPNAASKREALKRARAKASEKSIGPINESELRKRAIDEQPDIQDEFHRTYERRYDEAWDDAYDDPEFQTVMQRAFQIIFGTTTLDRAYLRVKQIFQEFDFERSFNSNIRDLEAKTAAEQHEIDKVVAAQDLFNAMRRDHPDLFHQFWTEELPKSEKSKGFERAFALEKLKKMGLTDYGTLVLDDWAQGYREHVWTENPGLALWIEKNIFPGTDFGPIAEGRDAALRSRKAGVSAIDQFSTPDQIRLALRDTTRISQPHRRALDWILRSGMLEKLPGLKFQIVDYIHGGGVGEYLPDSRIARFLTWTDADVPIHEFMHSVWYSLSPEDQQFIRDLRKATIAEKAPQMGEEFADGLTSDEFIDKKINRDLYHLSNEREFFTWLMTEKALADMNKPEVKTFVQKIQAIIRDLWNGFKDALGFSDYQDVLWRQLMSGKYEFSPEDAIAQSEAEAGRELALVRSRREAAEQAMNFDDMSDTQKRDMGSDIELQNTFVEPLAARLLQGRSRGIVSKLQRIFGDRLAALAETRGRGERHDVANYDQLMANPSIDPETKQIIVGDMEKNLRDFRSTAESMIALGDSKIQEYQQKIARLTEDLDVQKARRDLLATAARRIVSDYQNRYLNRIRQGGQAGEATVSAEVMRQLQQLRQSPEIVGRIIDQIATTVPEEVLTRPGITAPELLQALVQANGGNMETLSAAMGEAQRGVSREMLQVAIGIMQSSEQLADNVLAIRPTINPDNIREIESLAAELRQAAMRGARSDMRQLVREVGGTAQTLSMVRSAIGKLQPRIRRATRQLDEWMDAQEILEQSRNDPAFKALEEKVYKHFDVRSVVVTEGKDYEFTIKNPLTNEEVKILVGLDKATSGENYGKLQKLFDDAAAYLANPADPNYDPRLGAAWKYMIENAQQFWLNPGTNVFMPHMTPFTFDLPGFLSDPWKVLRTNAGLEANAAQVKLNAMAKTKKMLMEWDRKTGSSVDIINKKAARAAKMTVDQWYEDVFNQVAFHNQYLGQIAPRVGDVLTNGHVITREDLEAVKVNFAYLKRVREIAENTDAFTAASVNPARVIQGGISRRAEPTGPMTLPSRRSARALNWGREWRRLSAWQDRMRWLNSGDKFQKIVVAHMDTYSTPGYSVPTLWRDLYKGIVSDIRRGDGPETIEEISDILYDSQNFEELGPNAFTREQIQAQIVGEIDRGFRNFQAEAVTQQRAKPDPEIEALTAENSFTKPRSGKVTSPHSFYDYGVKDYAGRLRMGNDAYMWYGLDFLESLQRLQATLNRRIAELTEGIAPSDQSRVQKATRAAQLRGDEMFDLAELKLNAKRIKTLLKQQSRVMKSSRAGRTALESAFFRAQSTVGSLILMTPGARATHTFGMMGNSGVFNALLENRVVRPAAKGWARLVAAGVKDILKIPVSIPGLKVTNEQLRAWPEIAQAYAEMVINRREQMERLKEIGVIPESYFTGAWKSMWEDWRNVFRRESPETLPTRIGKALVAVSDAYNAAAMSYAPQRYNDWILNSSIREARNDFVLRLQENALKHLRNRSEVLGSGYSDFSRPENVLTAQEITGRKGPSAEREAFEKRRLFKSLGMDLDQIMLRYFRAVDEAQANGGDPGQIPFLTEAEGKSLDWEFAQGMGLSTPGTRNLAAQGSGILRRGAGYIHGLPLSTMGRYLSLFNRLSNQTAPKYAAAIGYPVLAASLYMTMMGLLKIQSTATLNRIFYKQSSALPTISQAKTPDDYARLMLRAFSLWFPIAGDIVLSAVLRTPDRFGHLDSMFVMYNFLQDVVNAAGDIWHTKDVAGTLTKFGERWLPPLKVFTRRSKSQSGVREHYNAVADIQASLPASMETAAAKFRGGLRPTETTPMTYRALNAMYNGDWAEFDRIAQEYAQKKSDQGVKDGLSAFKHSISAHNPWVERLGKLPTEEERQQILSRMDDTQRAEVKKAEETFQQFGNRYNTRVAFTAQQAEAERGAAGGGGEPTAGVGSVKLPGISRSGNVNVPHGMSSGSAVPGLRRISIGGRPRSPFTAPTGRLGGMRARRLSVGAPKAARRFTSGRLRASPRVSTRRGRRRRISLKV